MKNLAIAVLLATLLAACATPKPVAKGEESSPAPVSEGKRTAPTAPTVSSPEAVASALPLLQLVGLDSRGLDDIVLR